VNADLRNRTLETIALDLGMRDLLR
jgi:hypothetical protein